MPAFTCHPEIPTTIEMVDNMNHMIHIVNHVR